MHLERMRRCNVPATETCSLEKIANGIIVKGSVILGDGIGLYIVTKISAKTNILILLYLLLLHSYLHCKSLNSILAMTIITLLHMSSCVWEAERISHG